MAELKDVRNDYHGVSNLTSDIDNTETNIALLAFKVAAGDSLTKFEMVDQVIDDYIDGSGIDVGTSTNSNIDSGYYSGVAEGGYFGSGTDGALTTTGNVTHTVQNKYGAYDGDMVVMNYGNLTISAGHTMTVDQPCRGMLIYVDGDCTINGTLSMLGRGANATPSASGGAGATHTDGLMISYKKAGGATFSATSDLSGCGPAAISAVANHPTSGVGYVLQIPRVGGNGGATRSSSGGGNAGNVGDSGMNGTISNTIYKQVSCGGGGSGGAYWDGNSCGGGDAVSGRGGHSTCWTGGTGGGGKMSGSTAYAGDDYGGQGGQGHNNHCGGVHSASGGMGNPCGLDVYSNSNSTTQYTGYSGTGGILVLMVKGSLTIGASGIITTEGVLNSGSGRSLPGGCYGSGGSSGGGALAILHGGTYASSGSVTSAGGVGVNHGTGTGGAGGAGGLLIESIIASVEGDMSLVSNTATAEAIPTTGDIVMLLEDATGTATYGSTPGTGDDLRTYASRDAGTTWAEGTITNEGSWGTNKKILVARDIDISSQPSGQSMRYLIETYNQTAGGTPKTITANGNTVTKTGIKKFGTASCYQDSTGTFDNGALSIGNSTDWDFGTGDFTIDFWLYLFQTGSNKNQKIIGCSNYSSGWQGWHLKKDNGSMNLNWEGGANTTAFNTAGSSAIVAETWTHVAIVRISGTTKLYFDGVQKFSLAQSYAIQSTGSETLQIGGSYSDGNWEYPQMYIDEIRVSHGAHWTSDFTPWTAPYSVPSSYYKLLMHMDGADNGTTFTDDSPIPSKSTNIHATSLAWK